MAVSQIHVIWTTGGRNQLNDRIKYIMNPEKTACQGFRSFFGIKDTLTSGFTCACDEAYQQMMETKQHEKKTDKVLGYHYIQSFKPGEVTPEEAHQVGCEFIERCFAEDFEVVIGTHTDHAHIHNHIILNSVSFVDGHKFQSTPASFYKLREISDEICRAHHLSVIDDPKTRKAKHYAEWKAEQEYRPTIRNEIRRDIDVVLKQAHSLNNFWELLRLRGYEIKFNERRKYAAIRPPNGKRFIRMKSLGEEYTPRELVKRLEAADKSEVAANRRSFQQIYQQRKHRKKYYALPWTIIPHRRLTLRGIRALYWRYVYMLSKVRARKAPRAVRGVMLDELKKLERYSQQYYFLRDNRLNTKAVRLFHLGNQILPCRQAYNGNTPVRTCAVALSNQNTVHRIHIISSIRKYISRKRIHCNNLQTAALRRILWKLLLCLFLFARIALFLGFSKLHLIALYLEIQMYLPVFICPRM